MTTKKDPSGRRFVEVAFDLPGTPEQIWNAIATGPGISSWFVPSEVTVASVSESPQHRELTLRLEHPGPGVALIGTYVWDGRVNVAVSLYFYGDDPDALAAREGPVWQRWLDAHCRTSAPSASMQG